jgi:hypothetical protein
VTLPHQPDIRDTKILLSYPCLLFPALLDEIGAARAQPNARLAALEVFEAAAHHVSGGTEIPPAAPAHPSNCAPSTVLSTCR